VPLVGADIVDVWTPQPFFDECPPIHGCEEYLTSAQGGIDGSQPVQLPDTASLQGLSAAKEINPLYAALKEWKDEVANDLLESVFNCGGSMDPLEDIDLDEFFSDLTTTNNSLPRGPLSPLPPPPSSRDEAVDEKTREGMPSPAPSCDSGVSSALSSGASCSLPSPTGATFVPPSFGANSAPSPTGGALAPEFITLAQGPFEEGVSYVTIDPGALQLMHVDLLGAVEESTALGEEWTESKEEWTTIAMDWGHLAPTEDVECQEMVKEEESERRGGEDDDDDEEGEEENSSHYDVVSSTPSPVHHFHSYAQPPIEGAEGEGGGGKGGEKGKGRRKRAAKSEATAELRKTKKKEQNKTAAQRYRMKKKMEKGSTFKEEQEEEKRNKELKANVEALEKEIAYLKDLMAEVKRQRR